MFDVPSLILGLLYIALVVIAIAAIVAPDPEE